MANRLVHSVSVDSRDMVETVSQLVDALKGMSADCDDFLDKTYAVELLREELSDGSVKLSVSIREAEPV